MLAAGKVDPTHTAPANLGFPDGGRGVAECAVSFPSGSPQLAGTYIKWGPNKVVWYTKAWAPCFHDLTRQLQLSWEFNRPPIRSYIDRAVPALESDDRGPIQIIWDQTLLLPQIFPSFHRSPLPPMEPTKAYPPLDEDRIVPSWKYYAPIFGDCWGKKGKEAAARCAQDPRLIHAQDCGRTLEAEAYRRHQEACQALAALARSLPTSLEEERPLSPPKTPTLDPVPSTSSNSPDPNPLPVTSAPPSPTLLTTVPSNLNGTNPSPASSVAGPSTCTRPTKRKRSELTVAAGVVPDEEWNRLPKKIKTAILHPKIPGEPRCPCCDCLLYDNGECVVFSGVGCGLCRRPKPFRMILPEA